ncbi:MAG: TolC family protein [Flavobacteriales bacterium]|nr:TolC family protein [Flavobacteriales bacterium]
MNNPRTLLIILVMCSRVLVAQETKSLEQCLDLATLGNIDLKLEELNRAKSEAQLKQSKIQFLPEVNGFANQTYNFGQTIDPFTNQFVLDGIQTGGMGVEGSLNLFNGLSNVLDYRSAKALDRSNLANIQHRKRLIRFETAQQYLNTLMNQKLSKAMRQYGRDLKELSLKIDAQVKAGSKPQSDLEEAKLSQELSLLQAESYEFMALEGQQRLLNLLNETVAFQLKDIDPEDGFPGQIDSKPGYIPSIEAEKFRLQSSQKIAQKNSLSSLPRISLNAFVGTGYSGARKDIVGTTFVGYDTIGFVSSEPILREAYTFEQRTTPLQQQFQNNLNYSISLNLRIPIIRGGINKLNKQMSKISISEAKLSLEAEQKRVSDHIDNLKWATKSKQQAYDSKTRAFAIRKTSLERTDALYQNGKVDVFTLMGSFQQLILAHQEYLVSKHELIMTQMQYKILYQ